MPTLSRMARVGVLAESLLPVAPASLYPAAASLVTGRHPDRHGIVSDRALGERGARDTPLRHASQLEGASLWQSAGEADLSVAALGWPSTLGADIDLLLPEIGTLRRGQSWVQALAGATTPWLFKRVTQEASRPAAASAGWPSSSERDALLVELACEIARSPAPPQLWLLHLDQTREALRRHGPDSEGARAAFGRVDARVARLLACFHEAGLLESSAVVLVGDGGSLPAHTQVDPNVALARAGLIRREGGAQSRIRSWSAVVRSNGGSAFVYALGETQAVEARRILVEEGGRTRAFRVVSAGELQSLRVDPQAWFGLEAEPGFTFGDGAAPPILRPADTRAVGGYLFPGSRGDAGLVAWGPGLRRGVRVPRMHQIDVAPTVAALLGIPLPEADGRPLVGILGPAVARGLERDLRLGGDPLPGFGAERSADRKPEAASGGASRP
jgi:arylsulfatase A-like enzyme